MSINLVKGQTIDLKKGSGNDSYDLSKMTVGLGWDVRGGGGDDYDLDAIAFLLDSSEKIANLGKNKTVASGQQIGLVDSDIIFFNNLKHPSGQIWLTGDNRTGEGEGDDEQIIVNLNSLDKQYQKILFLVTIYQGRNKRQHFGMVENAFIRAVDKNGKEIVKYTISGDQSMNGKCSMIFAEVYRKDDTWKFRALGQPMDTDSFVEIAKNYIR